MTFQGGEGVIDLDQVSVLALSGKMQEEGTIQLRAI
jgi:hypothetical protein